MTRLKKNKVAPIGNIRFRPNQTCSIQFDELPCQIATHASEKMQVSPAMHLLWHYGLRVSGSRGGMSQSALIECRPNFGLVKCSSSSPNRVDRNTRP